MSEKEEWNEIEIPESAEDSDQVEYEVEEEGNGWWKNIESFDEWF